MSPGYPALLNLAGRRCVVVGAGAVATRKVETLLECHATVTVIAVEAAAAIQALAEAGRVALVLRAPQPDDFANALLVIAATNNPQVNTWVVEQARLSGALAGRVDRGDSDFVSAAVARHGDVSVAISTSGRSPAFAHWLRERVEAVLAESAALFEVMAEVRADLVTHGSSLATSASHPAVTPQVERALADGDRQAARVLLSANLAAAAEPGPREGRP